IRILTVKPPAPAILHRPAFSAVIELGEKSCDILSAFKIFRVESIPAVMGDEAAVQREMLVEPIAEVLEAQSVLEKPHPDFQHERFIARAQELAVMENMIHKQERTLLKAKMRRRAHGNSFHG